VETRRNLSDLPLAGAMKPNQRLELEIKVQEAFNIFKAMPDFGGKYYSMTKEHPDYLDPEGWANLRTADGRRAMPQDTGANDKVLQAAGIAGAYPKGRGCYMTDNGETVIWVGGEDHLRIACVKEGKMNAFNDVLDNLRMILDLFPEALPFAESEKYGIITASPQYVGTAMRAFANVQLPHLIADGLGNAIEIAEEQGLKVSQRSVEDMPDPKSAANRVPAEAQCEVSVNAKFGVSEADEANKLLEGLKALAEGELKIAAVKGVPHVLVSTHGTDNPLNLGSKENTASAEGGENQKEEASEDQKGRLSPEKRRDSETKEDHIPRTWNALEEWVLNLANNKTMLDSMWDSMKIGEAPANADQITVLIEDIDRRLTHTKEPLLRAFAALVSSEQAVQVQRREYFTVLSGCFYFARMFHLFPDAETNREKRLDLAEFKDVISKLEFATQPNAAEVFDAMESNDGGLISFDDMVAWYTSQRSPQATMNMNMGAM